MSHTKQLAELVDFFGQMRRALPTRHRKAIRAALQKYRLELGDECRRKGEVTRARWHTLRAWIERPWDALFGATGRRRLATFDNVVSRLKAECRGWQRIATERGAWIEELEAAKVWLEAQLCQWQRLADEREARITDLLNTQWDRRAPGRKKIR